MLVLLEGPHDIEFLTRLSARLFPDNHLTHRAANGSLVLVPVGGEIARWADRLAPLGCREFHLYDRELEPLTSERLRLIEQIRARPHCQAQLLSRRSLENFLHPAAIQSAGGGLIQITPDSPVATDLARHWYEQVPQPRGWHDLPGKPRSRFIQHAKRWLATVAVDHMTRVLLAESDPTHELTDWLTRVLDASR